MQSLEPEVAWGRGTHLGHKVLKAGDDVGAFKLLIVAEAASDHNHSDECHCQVQLGWGREGAGLGGGAGSSLQEVATCSLVPWCSWGHLCCGFPRSAKKPHARFPVAFVPCPQILHI